MKKLVTFLVLNLSFYYTFGILLYNQFHNTLTEYSKQNLENIFYTIQDNKNVIKNIKLENKNCQLDKFKNIYKIYCSKVDKWPVFTLYLDRKNIDITKIKEYISIKKEFLQVKKNSNKTVEKKENQIHNNKNNIIVITTIFIFFIILFIIIFSILFL